jgi:hypothetical protein
MTLDWNAAPLSVLGYSAMTARGKYRVYESPHGFSEGFIARFWSKDNEIWGDPENLGNVRTMEGAKALCEEHAAKRGKKAA